MWHPTPEEAGRLTTTCHDFAMAGSRWWRRDPPIGRDREVSPDVFAMHGQFSPPRAGDVLVTASIGADGQAVALWATPDAAAALHGRTSIPGGASFADVTLAEPVEAVVTSHAGSKATGATSLDELRMAHPAIQPMPGGELLVVGARCRWTPVRVEPNAALFAEDGSLLRTAVVGDGVQHLRSTSTGEIWVGYSDEGVYGNFGWGHPGPAPVGRNGLARFDPDLTLAWEFPWDDRRPRIDDCEALNVGSDVWACYYSEFPLVRIADGSVQFWPPTRLDSLTTLLVDHDRIAFVGTDITFAHIEGDILRVTSSIPLALPPDARTPGTQLIGQSSTLHVLTPAGAWYKADLDTLAP